MSGFVNPFGWTFARKAKARPAVHGGESYCSLCGACSICVASEVTARYCHDSSDHKHRWNRSASSQEAPKA